jgi:hypothetical protein
MLAALLPVRAWLQHKLRASGKSSPSRVILAKAMVMRFPGHAFVEVEELARITHGSLALRGQPNLQA